jgi:hypothetical protein
MMEKKHTAQEPLLSVTTRKHVLLINVILFSDVSSNTLSTMFANLDANALTMLIAKIMKESTIWQNNASRQSVTNLWELVLKFLLIRNAKSREENAKMIALLMMLVILLNVSNPLILMILYANIPQDLVMMELNAPKILAIQ